jgi:hypothetical protein
MLASARSTWFSTFIAVISFCITASVALSSSFTVEQWNLGTGVAGSWPNIDGVSNTTVSNPLHELQSAQVGSSTANTTYAISWNDTFGDFLVQTTHRAADVDPLHMRSISAGSIYVTAMSDLLFTADAAYSYILPVDPMYTAFAFTVYDAQPPNLAVFNGGGFYDTIHGSPASGNFPVSGQAILAAGHTWVIAYQMEVNAYYGYSGQIALGDGYLHFTLQAVPEPATLVPLAVGALIARRRRAR